MSALPIPSHFDPATVSEVWRVDYLRRAQEAREWAMKNSVAPAGDDDSRTALLLVDCQNTFCIPGHELFVGGRSGRGAVDDNVRLCEFIYRNLGSITEIIPTLDTHTAVQIFHPAFWVNYHGEHPEGGATIIGVDEVETGVWSVNPAIAKTVGRDLNWLSEYALHYVRNLRSPLMIWPYHAMLGGIGHALVSAVEEAVFFHSIARETHPRFEVKGRNPLTEHYSVLSADVLVAHGGEQIAEKNQALIEHLSRKVDNIVVAGQAKSHCVSWTVQDLLNELDEGMAARIQLLDDCTSAVVVPEVVDFTDTAAETFRGFSEAGISVVRSTDLWL